MRPETWMRAAGFGTWLVAVVPSALAFARGDLAGPYALGFGIAAIGFIAAFTAASCLPSGGRNAALAMCAAQSAAAIGMVWFGRGVVTAAIFVVVASQLPKIVSGGGAMVWVVVQSATIAFQFDARHVGPALVNCAAFAGFEAFAVAAASLVASERRTRSAAAEHDRTVERLRVARDLHDALGHHLTALGMQLEVAARLADGRAKEHVERAHAIGRLLLADVRSAVSDLRAPRALGAALRSLTAAPGSIAVHLDMTEDLDGLGGDRAEAITRCVQELITNSSRHGDARHLWIAITADRSTIRLHARDDGRNASAAHPIAWGHGLTGMRERFVALGGHVDARVTPGGGFAVETSMPRRRP